MAQPAQATDYNFACNGIAPAEGFEPCTGDRWGIAPGKFVRLTNVSAGNKNVTFKVYNNSGHHLLGTTSELKPGAKGFAWRNDTSSTIKIDVEADPNACCVTVDVNARVSITSS